MDKELEEKITQHVKENIKLESELNKEDDSLPYGYCHPDLDGKLFWICGYDAEGKITSVFCDRLNGQEDKHSQYFEDNEVTGEKGIDKAKYVRDELVNAGWTKIKTPEITFSFPGEEKKKLNRNQRRYLAKKVKQLQKQNPFE